MNFEPYHQNDNTENLLNVIMFIKAVVIQEPISYLSYLITFSSSLITHIFLDMVGEINKLLRAVNKPVNCPVVILEIVF